MEPTATMLLHAWRGGEAARSIACCRSSTTSWRASPARPSAPSGPITRCRRARLVHEAYLRLVDADISWQDHAHFMAVAARTMRRVLVDHARARRRHKRGGGAVRVELEDVAGRGARAPSVDVLDLHDVLERLAAFDARKAAIVELHFFGGLSYDETAEAVGVSPATVDRELRLAKAWLRDELDRQRRAEDA